MHKFLKYLLSASIVLPIISHAEMPLNTSKVVAQEPSINTTVRVSANLYKRVFVNSIAQVLAQRPLNNAEKFCFIHAYNEDEKFLTPLFRKEFNPLELTELEKFFQSALGQKLSNYMINAVGNNATVRPFSPDEEKQIESFFKSETGVKYRKGINSQLYQLAESQYMTRVILCNIPIKSPKT